MDLETSFMGFFIAFEAKIIDFWSNIETFYHLTTSNMHPYQEAFNKIVVTAVKLLVGWLGDILSAPVNLESFK